MSSGTPPAIVSIAAPAIARGERRSSRRSDAPNPGRSIANRRACSASVVQSGANAYTLSGQGLVSRIHRLRRATAIGVPDPDATDGLEADLWGRCHRYG